MVQHETRLGKELRREILRGLRDSEKEIGANGLWILIGLSNCWSQNPKGGEWKQEVFVRE